MKHVLGIGGAVHYWLEVVQLNWVDFSQRPTPRTAFNLATSLWHLIEWVAADPTTNCGSNDARKLQDHLVAQCPALGVMHDIATGFKHWRVSTPRGGVEDSHLELLGATLVFGAGGPMSENAAQFTVNLSDGQDVPLQPLFVAALQFWQQYLSSSRKPENQPEGE